MHEKRWKPYVYPLLLYVSIESLGNYDSRTTTYSLQGISLCTGYIQLSDWSDLSYQVHWTQPVCWHNNLVLATNCAKLLPRMGELACLYSKMRWIFTVKTAVWRSLDGKLEANDYAAYKLENPLNHVPSLPIIVKVFPEPVWPYAKMQTLKPSKADCSRKLVSLNTSSLLRIFTQF